MKNASFSIQTNSSKSRARRGTIKTAHGNVETPAFVTVGTKATIKGLAPEDLQYTNTQFMFANTYHLVLSPGADLVEKAGGVHEMSGIDKPMITDSGGFQVFSLAFQNRKNMYELHVDNSSDKEQPKLVKITDDGVEFRSHIDGEKFFFTPEYSVDVQGKIGADFVVAFDECIYNGATKKYTKQATDRTHAWAKRSLDALYDNQEMYGVIQGGLYKDLRQESTEHIASLPFFGIALGGVSVGETNEELRQTVDWIQDVLHRDPRPRHLLGISTFEDVLYAVKQGVDTFDCILPTRDARIGTLYTYKGDPEKLEDYDRLRITRGAFKTDLSPIDEHCGCHVCENYSRAYLHHLFKQRELLAYRLATIHNLHFIEDFFARIRKAIEAGTI